MSNRKVRSELLRVLVNRFDETELRMLCFDLEIDYQGLAGTKLAEKAMELIAFCERRNRFEEFIRTCQQVRSDIDWESIIGTPPPTPHVQPASSVSSESTDTRTKEAIDAITLAQYKYNSERYGVSYEEIQILCTIASDGSARVCRRVKVKAYSTISELDIFLLIPERATPNLRGRDLGFIAIQSLTPGREIVLVHPQVQPGSISAVINITPPLANQDDLEYELVEKVPPDLYAIDLTEDELVRRSSPYDYFGWNINRPTKGLQLEVIFPNGIEPRVYDCEVRFASVSPGLPSDHRQREEEARLKKPDLRPCVGERFALTLHVDYPMIGLIYILRWRPVARELMESSR